ncbi:hypothetical protein [Fusobacterium pseudoperiodonticum]|nr:hypothetical protein [Fusobacterium pseudoperiodonticum]
MDKLDIKKKRVMMYFIEATGRNFISIIFLYQKREFSSLYTQKFSFFMSD